MKDPAEYTLKDYLKLDDASLLEALRVLSDKELVFLHWQTLSDPETAAGQSSSRMQLLEACIRDEEAKRFEHEVLKSHKKFRKKLQKRNSDADESEDD